VKSEKGKIKFIISSFEFQIQAGLHSPNLSGGCKEVTQDSSLAHVLDIRLHFISPWQVRLHFISAFTTLRPDKTPWQVRLHFIRLL